MLYNATLTRIDAPTGSTPGGTPAYVTGAAISVRCNAGDVAGRHRLSLGAVIEQATGILAVRKADLEAAGITAAIAARHRLTVAVDRSAARTYRVLHVVNHEKAGELAHWECFLELE